MKMPKGTHYFMCPFKTKFEKLDSSALVHHSGTQKTDNTQFQPSKKKTEMQ